MVKETASKSSKKAHRIEVVHKSGTCIKVERAPRVYSHNEFSCEESFLELFELQRQKCCYADDRPARELRSDL